MTNSIAPRSYRGTRLACYIGYIVQAIVANFAPLLFITFNRTFDISLTKITLLSGFNFTVQFLVDLFAAHYAEKLGYRKSVIISQVLAAVGMASYGILPYILRDPFVGLLIATLLSAIGGGLIEVLISPIIESCPSDSKSGSMSLLHSFYSWGQAGVVLLSTLFFTLFEIDNWQVLTVIWAAVPAINIIIFAKVPVPQPTEDGEAMSSKQLFRTHGFGILILLMICSGAAELAIAQWASAFAEAALNVNKTVGDLAGPCLFAILMGISRILYSVISKKIGLIRFMAISGGLCLAGYLMASLSPIPALSLAGCALCGFAVGIFWPGTVSIAAKLFPKGGTFMFGILALSGDIGCVTGTGFVGFVSGLFGDNLKMGILCASIFPILMIIGLLLCKRITVPDTDAEKPIPFSDMTDDNN